MAFGIFVMSTFNCELGGCPGGDKIYMWIRWGPGRLLQRTHMGLMWIHMGPAIVPVGCTSGPYGSADAPVICTSRPIWVR